MSRRSERRLRNILPFDEVPDNLLQNETGNPVVRQGRRRNRNVWRARSSPLQDESVLFDTRLTLTTEFDPLVYISISTRNELYVQFLEKIQYMLRRARGNPTLLRIYLVKTSTNETFLIPSLMDVDLTFYRIPQDLQVIPARILSAINRYMNEDLYSDREFSLKFYVDYNSQGGAGRPDTNLPRELKRYKGLWGTKSNSECFIWCLKHFYNLKGINKSKSELVKTLKYRDNINYNILFPNVVLFLKDLRLILWDSSVTEKLIEVVGVEYVDNECNLILCDSHYYLITDMNLLRSNEQEYCDFCDKWFKKGHRCRRNFVCDICKYDWVNMENYFNHKDGSWNVRKLSKCPICDRQKFYSNVCRLKHVEHCKNLHQNFATTTDYHKCQNCDTSFVASHTCYLERQPKREDKYFQWYAFDYESMLIPDGERFKHKVNFVCVQKLFDQTIRYNFETIDEFLNWIKRDLHPLVNENDEPLIIGMIAHNLKGYDGRLTLAELFKTTDTENIEDMIWTGAKINTFKWGNVVFRDSLLHIQLPLSAFPKTFNLLGESVEICKGFFPYDFNIPQNQSYIGPIP
ncbi:MAG: hypothetical protein EBS55_11640, partial [Flavobacteriaceae bacterium]|nr:hypothetical protein [Flavobacteriaceae bacterium]